MKTHPQTGRLTLTAMLALLIGLTAGCSTLPPTTSVKATVNAPGFPAAPAKVYVDDRAFPNHGLKITREFSERYGANYREKLDERYATALAAGDLWARREAARIEAHAKFAPAVAAVFAVQGYTLVAKDEADYLVNFSFSAIPWEDLPMTGRNLDIPVEAPRDEVRLYLEIRRAHSTREQARLPLWSGELYAEKEAAPMVFLKTLMLYVGRNFAGEIPLAGN